MKTESEERGAQRRPGSRGKGRALAVVAIALILGTTGAVQTPARAQPADTIVQTEGGLVRGFVDGSTKTWAGLPYAAPPVGDLRWRPPSPPPAWVGVRDTTAFADACIQPEWPDGVTGTEDCLYVNVFAPESSVPAAELPVMVHLHPGGNGSGRAYRNADSFVQRGVVVVTLGYRLGVFRIRGAPQAGRGSGRAVRRVRRPGPDRGTRMGTRQHRGIRWRPRQRHAVRLLCRFLRCGSHRRVTSDPGAHPPGRIADEQG